MIKLEELYEAAGELLTGDKQNWAKFANEFATIFDAKMALYSPNNGVVKDDELDISSSDEIIATTSPEIIKQYFDEKLYEIEEQTTESPENPFEPIRRTDSINNEEFIKLDIAKQFMLPNGIYYKMVVFAILPNGAFLVLFVWRNEEEGDFSDIEKQRIALFMRHLALCVGRAEPLLASQNNDDIATFGKKYSLTDSEVDILSALLQGKSLKDISNDSDRTYGTVRWHVRNILEKCHVKSQRNLLNEFYALIKS